MYAGQVVESGTVAEVLGQPAHPYTAALLGANPHVAEGLPVPERLPSIPGTVPAPAGLAVRAAGSPAAARWPPTRARGRCRPPGARHRAARRRHGALRPPAALTAELRAPGDLPVPRPVEPGVPS